MEITSFTCMFKIQDPLTLSTKNLEPFRSILTKAPLRQGTQESDLTTNFLTKLQIISHLKKLKKELSFQLFLLLQSQD